MLKVNGVLIPALLDTGSPITVLNAAAAKAAGIGDAPPAAEDVSSNPFTMLTQAFKAGVAATKAETLMVAGANGPVQLLRCEDGATMSLGDADLGGGTCRRNTWASCPVWLALDGLGLGAGGGGARWRRPAHAAAPVVHADADFHLTRFCIGSITC